MVERHDYKAGRVRWSVDVCCNLGHSSVIYQRPLFLLFHCQLSHNVYREMSNQGLLAYSSCSDWIRGDSSTVSERMPYLSNSCTHLARSYRQRSEEVYARRQRRSFSSLTQFKQRERQFRESVMYQFNEVIYGAVLWAVPGHHVPDCDTPQGLKPCSF